MDRNQIDTIATDRIMALYGSDAAKEGRAKINGCSLSPDPDGPLVRWYAASELSWMDDLPADLVGAWAIDTGFVHPRARLAAGLRDDGTLGPADEDAVLEIGFDRAQRVWIQVDPVTPLPVFQRVNDRIWPLVSVPVADTLADTLLVALRADGLAVEIQLRADTPPGCSVLAVDPTPDRPERERLASRLAELAEREVRAAAGPDEIVDAAAESAAHDEWHRAMELPLAELRLEIGRLDEQAASEPRYRFWRGGGTAQLALVGTFTAEEIRRRLLADPGKGMRYAEVAASLEVAFAAGSGSGSHGTFGHGTAAGSPILSWRIERVEDDLDEDDRRVAARIADLPELEPAEG